MRYVHNVSERVCIALLMAFSIAGCGGSQFHSGNGNPPATAVAIITQPASVTVPEGQIASFSVAVTGSSPVTYQWFKDGVPIDGGSSDSYMTPPVVFGDNSATYTVSVSNSINSVTSNPAVLTVGARSPKAGDLRFQQVDAASTENGYTGSVTTILPSRLGLGFGNQTGTPVSIGPGTCAFIADGTPYDCGWPINVFNLPASVSGLGIQYWSDYLESFDQDVGAAIQDPHTVVTSIDTESRDDAFAISYMQADGGDAFNLAQHTVAPADLQAAATQEGINSRVITAVSYKAGQAYYFSYGWQGDTTTVYEAKVETATFDTIAVAATDLAAQGYILTALGGNVDDGFLLIGTRVKGDTLPRPMRIVPLHEQATELWQTGFSIVGNFVDTSGSETLIGER